MPRLPPPPPWWCRFEEAEAFVVGPRLCCGPWWPFAKGNNVDEEDFRLDPIEELEWELEVDFLCEFRPSPPPTTPSAAAAGGRNEWYGKGEPPSAAGTENPEEN